MERMIKPLDTFSQENLLVCPICRNEAGNKLLQFEEKMFRMGGYFEYVDCGHCGAMSIVDLPQDLARYYPTSNYYSVLEKSGLRSVLMRLRDLAYTTAYPGAGLVRKYLPNSALATTLSAIRTQSDRILDVGCGEGALLKSLARLGLKNLTGVDLLIGQNREVDGIHLVGGELADVLGQFDVITFHHSLEHMCNPQAVMSQARSLLSKGGRIVVRIPSRDSLAYLIYRENWFQIDAPRHMCIHSHRSMEIVAEQAGLKIIQIDCDSRPMQFWASDMYRSGLPLGSAKLGAYKRKHRSLYREMAEFANRNGLGDQIVVHLVAA